MENTKSLKKNKDFKFVLNYGQYFIGKYLVLYIKKNNTMPKWYKNREDKCNNYLGICVNKKHGNSVVRNKLKRWIRNIYTISEKNIPRGISIVVLYKKNVNFKDINYDLICEELNYLLNSIKNN